MTANSSMPVRHVILVDENDQQVGTCEKLKAHELGLRHRAFSIVLLKIVDDEVYTLIQKRHPNKYHTGGLWSNSCCSHPGPGESIVEAATRRLNEELSIKTDLIYLDAFEYRVVLDDAAFEHEIDHVFIGFYDHPECHHNPDEIVLTKWIEWSELIDDIKARPKQFTPWLYDVLKLIHPHLIKLIT